MIARERGCECPEKFPLPFVENTQLLPKGNQQKRQISEIIPNKG
jgi:hypothetical protein